MCKNYQSIIYDHSSCCPVASCICDVSKCETGVVACSTNKHAKVTLVNECCEHVECECNDCLAPMECKEGWIVVDNVDDCNCITSN